jgi:hypothetical protein
MLSENVVLLRQILLQQPLADLKKLALRLDLTIKTTKRLLIEELLTVLIDIY